MNEKKKTSRLPHFILLQFCLFGCNWWCGVLRRLFFSSLHSGVVEFVSSTTRIINYDSVDKQWGGGACEELKAPAPVLLFFPCFLWCCPRCQCQRRKYYKPCYLEGVLTLLWAEGMLCFLILLKHLKNWLIQFQCFLTDFVKMAKHDDESAHRKKKMEQNLGKRFEGGETAQLSVRAVIVKLCNYIRFTSRSGCHNTRCLCHWIFTVLNHFIIIVLQQYYLLHPALST